MQLLTEGELRRRVIVFTRQSLAAGTVTQRELARRTHFSQGYLSLVVSGAREPSAEVVDALIRCLRIHLPDLFTCSELATLTAKHTSLLEAVA